jgi:peptide/nickel transport system ATP-binding protein
MNSLLQIKNLVTSFQSEERTVVAVNNISLSINAGETLAIVGESGSGKSVTSLSILRLLNEKTSRITGEVLFQKNESWVDLQKISEQEMRTFRGKEIAMIFQEPMTSLNPVITCGEQVAEVLRLHLGLNRKEAKEKTIELFNKVKLPRAEFLYHSYPHQISGGQKQRVMIAMAISCNPRLLIADEPTTALDVTVQKSILDLLREIQDEFKMSIIFITHDLGVVSELAQKVAIMYKGKIVEKGTVNEIFKNPQHSYTKGLLSCRPNLNIRWPVLPTINDFMKENSDGSYAATGYSLSLSDTSIVEINNQRKKRLNLIYQKNPLLTLDRVNKSFTVRKSGFGRSQSISAVKDVNLSLFQGETLGLVGESGCGKSTLGKLVLRLLEPTSGKIIYQDRDLSQLSLEEMRQLRKKIQVIFQDPYSSLNPIQRIGDAIAEPMIVHKIYSSKAACRKAAMELLERVGLGQEHYHRFPHEFSGGQRQRIVIARALSVNPEFIICDECVSALDVSVQAQIINLLQQLKKEQGFSYIFISHDLSVVKYISDRIAVMKAGSIEEIGDADEIYDNPKSNYTRQLIDAIPRLTFDLKF